MTTALSFHISKMADCSQSVFLFCRRTVMILEVVLILPLTEEVDLQLYACVTDAALNTDNCIPFIYVICFTAVLKEKKMLKNLGRITKYTYFSFDL